MENRLTTVEKTCANLIDGQAEIKEQLVDVQISSKETSVSVEKILTNHLPHIQSAIEVLSEKVKLLFWVWAFGVALIAALIALK